MRMNAYEEFESMLNEVVVASIIYAEVMRNIVKVLVRRRDLQD
jgi:hypothetical protein